MNENKEIIKINELDYYQLKELKKAIKNGSLLEEIENNIKKFENPNLVCPVCNAKVNEEDSFILYFGPKELRRKARFCGIDCLEYFINNYLK